MKMKLLIILLLSLSLIGPACLTEKEPPRYRLPYPDAKLIDYFQSRVDSSEYEWLTDTKGIASAFMNEYTLGGQDISTNDVVVKSEGIFRAQVLISLDTVSYNLILERPFKERGAKSIWQVISLEEKSWQKSPSK